MGVVDHHTLVYATRFENPMKCCDMLEVFQGTLLFVNPLRLD